MGEKQQKYSLENELPSFEAPKKRKISIFKKKNKQPKKQKELPPRPIDEKVHHSKKFKFANGKSARNILELKEHIDNLSEVSLKKHINKDKHEISEWVDDNFNRSKLAKQLEKAKSKKPLLKVLEKHIQKELPPETLPELPEFTKLEIPSFPKMKKKTGIPPRAPNKLGGRLAGSLPSLEDDLIPPEPTKDMLVKHKSLFGKPTKTKKEHLEIDRIITRKQEEKRHKDKNKFLFKKENELREKELNLAEIEKAQVRQDEKIYSLKKVFDHDVRQRLNHINTKDIKLRDLKKGLEEERKHYEEKDQIMDKLRQRYLDFIAKEAHIEEKEKTLEKKKMGLDQSIKKLESLNNSIDQKFTKLKELNTEIQIEWKSKFSRFENLNHLNELKEKELLPKISRLQDDIILFTHKEKVLNKNSASIKDVAKQIKELEKKKNESLNTLEKLRGTKIHLDKKSLILNQKEKELLRHISKVKKNKEIKENTNILREKLFNIEKRLSESSTILLNFPELEQKSLELNNRSISLDTKAKALLKNLDKIEKNKELNENTKTLKDRLSKVEKRLKEKSKELIALEVKSQKLKDLDLRLDARKTKVERLEKQLKEEKKTISDKHKVYEKQMKDIMDSKFHSYLEKTIKKTQMPRDKDYKHNQIYILIDNCKDLIDLGKVLETKKLYNKIRSLFIELNLKGTEHQILKETIKDLYNQIKLASVK